MERFSRIALLRAAVDEVLQLLVRSRHRQLHLLLLLLLRRSRLSVARVCFLLLSSLLLLVCLWAFLCGTRPGHSGIPAMLLLAVLLLLWEMLLLALLLLLAVPLQLLACGDRVPVLLVRVGQGAVVHSGCLRMRRRLHSGSAAGV